MGVHDGLLVERELDLPGGGGPSYCSALVMQGALRVERELDLPVSGQGQACVGISTRTSKPPSGLASNCTAP